MKKLGLKEWSAVAEIGGTIGVVVSLLMVVYSLNQNTVAISGQGVNEIYDGYREMQLVMIENPEILMVANKGKTDYDSLSEMEKQIYNTYIALNLDLWDRMTTRELEGLISPESSQAWHAFFREWTKRYVSRALWEQEKWGWSPGRFYEMVEAQLDH